MTTEARKAVYMRARKMWQMGACRTAGEILLEEYSAAEAKAILVKWTVSA